MSEDKKAGLVTTAWQDLMNRPMSRKQFLGIVGFGALTIVGLGPLLKALKQGNTPQHSENPVYGGEQATAPAPTKRA